MQRRGWSGVGEGGAAGGGCAAAQAPAAVSGQAAAMVRGGDSHTTRALTQHMTCRRTVLLHGPPGTGKTLLAKARALPRCRAAALPPCRPAPADAAGCRRRSQGRRAARSAPFLRLIFCQSTKARRRCVWRAARTAAPVLARSTRARSARCAQCSRRRAAAGPASYSCVSCARAHAHATGADRAFGCPAQLDEIDCLGRARVEVRYSACLLCCAACLLVCLPRCPCRNAAVSHRVAGQGEKDSERRMKTELLTQLDGLGSDNKGILFLAATNVCHSTRLLARMAR